MASARCKDFHQPRPAQCPPAPARIGHSRPMLPDSFAQHRLRYISPEKGQPRVVGLQIIGVCSGGLIKQAVGIMKIAQQPTGQCNHRNILRAEHQTRL